MIKKERKKNKLTSYVRGVSIVSIPLASLTEFVRSRKENKLSSLRGCVNQPTDKHTLLRGRCMRGVSVSNSASYVYIYTNKFSTKNKNKSPFLKFLLKNKTNFILFLKNKTLSFLVGFFNFLGNKLSYYSPLI